MGTIADAREAAYELFEDGWGTTTPILTPNSGASPPDDAGMFVRFSIDPGTMAQRELSGPRRHHGSEGIVFIQILSKSDQGDGGALGLADTAADIFRNKIVSITDGNLSFRVPSIRPIGLIEGWYQVNVEAPFQLKTIY